jgi:hypothetical protein
MASRPLNVESMLSAAFQKAELDFLHQQKRFQDEVATVKTASDFQHLCETSEQLLGEYGRANKSPRHLRN